MEKNRKKQKIMEKVKVRKECQKAEMGRKKWKGLIRLKRSAEKSGQFEKDHKRWQSIKDGNLLDS